MSKNSEVNRKIILIISLTFAMIFIAAGIIHVLQATNLGGFKVFYPESLEQKSFNYDTAFYYIIITVMTVGYGDVRPDDNFSRMLIGCFIVSMIIFLSK